MLKDDRLGQHVPTLHPSKGILRVHITHVLFFQVLVWIFLYIRPQVVIALSSKNTMLLKPCDIGLVIVLLIQSLYGKQIMADLFLRCKYFIKVLILYCSVPQHILYYFYTFCYKGVTCHIDCLMCCVIVKNCDFIS